ncbi:hypothetical protein PINS_up006113 [Pythium insidiosum]|nr:hypothetical protein PINS_up006113 [Pythium insidiosum]
MLYHGVACLHFGITQIEGFSPKEEAWIPSDDIFLERVNETYYRTIDDQFLHLGDSRLSKIAATQYFRSLYYAANVLAAVGKTIEPDSEVQYIFALAFMLSGFLITSIVVDNVQKRFTATAFEHKQFYAIRTRIQLFLLRQKAPLSIFQRVNSFLDFWWSAHRGAFINELLADLPSQIRRDLMVSICSPALHTLALMSGVRPMFDKMEDFFVANVKFILFGQGEVVYRQGDYASGIYFLLEGEVCVITNAENPRGMAIGTFFGTAALTAGGMTDGYGEHVSASSGCILLFISREHLVRMEELYPQLPTELLALEKKLSQGKLAHEDLSRHGRKAKRRRSAVTSIQLGNYHKLGFSIVGMAKVSIRIRLGF